MNRIILDQLNLLDEEQSSYFCVLAFPSARLPLAYIC